MQHESIVILPHVSYCVKKKYEKCSRAGGKVMPQNGIPFCGIYS